MRPVGWLSTISYNPSNIFARARLVQTRHVTEYSPTKTGEYQRIYPDFQICARCVKDLKDNKHDSLHLGRKYARIFVLGHYLFLEAHIFPRAALSENCSLLGTDMSADKYPSIFSRQMETIVYISNARLWNNCEVCQERALHNYFRPCHTIYSGKHIGT